MSGDNVAPDGLLGVTIAGRYRIVSRLGAGGMGVAYRAWDEQGGVPVVIKIPKRIFLEDPKFAERFHREIRLLQGFEHPHIVPIVDVGDHDGLPFVVMRFLPGGSLSNRRLRDEQGKPRPNAPATLHLWLPAIAEALDYVHSQGVVHRDVKPANIFFNAFWGAYLGDFGIAKIVEESDAFDKEHTLTATHMGIGTPEYMAPEQFTPKAVIDGKADQYALGVIVYEMLAGKRPFTGETESIVVEVKTFPVPPLLARRRDVSPAVVQAVHRALAKQPAERFATCREFANAVLQDVPPMTDEPGVARLLCPNHPCNNLLVLRTDYAGKKGKCPRCKKEMAVAKDLGALWLVREEHEGDEPAGDGEDAEGSADVFTSLSGTNPLPQAGVRKIWSQLDPKLRRAAIGTLMLASLLLTSLLAGNFAARDSGKTLAFMKAEQKKLLAENERLRKEVEGLTAEQNVHGENKNKVETQSRPPRPTRVMPPSLTADELQAKLKATNREYDGTGRIDFINGKIVEVHLGSKKIMDITALKGLPLGAVALDRTQVNDLSPLAGMPLRWINLDESPGVTDISPLKRMPLAELYMARTGVADLEPLRRMPLKRLNVEGTKVKDLSPLQGMPLEWLNLNFVSTYPSFTPLKGMPLRELHAHGTAADDLAPLAGTALVALNINYAERLTDIRPLRGLPLRDLNIQATKISDLRALHGMPLRGLDAEKSAVESLAGIENTSLVWLNLGTTAIKDLAPLRGLKLEYLNLNDAGSISELGPLAGMPLVELHLHGTKVSNIGPLKGMPLRVLNLERTPVVDVGILDPMPLRYLNLRHTPFTSLGTER
jgi:hypothetical protein